MVQRDVFSLVDWSERLQTSDSLVVAMLTLALEYVPLRTVQRGERLRAMLPAQIQRAMYSQVVLLAMDLQDGLEEPVLMGGSWLLVSRSRDELREQHLAHVAPPMNLQDGPQG